MLALKWFLCSKLSIGNISKMEIVTGYSESIRLRIDLLRAFGCLSYDLIIAKLNAHRFSPSALKLMQSYLTLKLSNRNKTKN